MSLQRTITRIASGVFRWFFPTVDHTIRTVALLAITHTIF